MYGIFFFKAFETEIGALIGSSEVHELSLHIANFEEMPHDIHEVSTHRFDLADTLENRPVRSVVPMISAWKRRRSCY